jgi:hypothetical protein
MDIFYGSHLQRQAYGARLHEFIGREQMMSIHTMVLKMEACVSVVNQDQAFEAGFSNEG